MGLFIEWSVLDSPTSEHVSKVNMIPVNPQLNDPIQSFPGKKKKGLFSGLEKLIMLCHISTSKLSAHVQHSTISKAFHNHLHPKFSYFSEEVHPEYASSSVTESRLKCIEIFFMTISTHHSRSLTLPINDFTRPVTHITHHCSIGQPYQSHASHRKLFQHHLQSSSIIFNHLQREKIGVKIN